MQIISTRVHGYLDYALGALLIASPWLWDFAFGEAETWVPVGVGIASMAYSLCTDYELGAVRRLGMPTHLRLDFLGGAFLLASPWLFDFSNVVQGPHVLLGLAALVIVGFSRRAPPYTPLTEETDVPPGQVA